MEDYSIDIMPLLGAAIYPQTVTPLAVAHPDSVRLIDEEGGAPRRVAVVALRDPARRPDLVTLADCFDVGCIALVHLLLRLPDGTLRVAVEGLDRCVLVGPAQSEGRLRAAVRPLPDQPTESPRALAKVISRLRAHVSEIASRPPSINPDLVAEIAAEEDLGRLSYLLAIPILAREPLDDRQSLLALTSVNARLAFLDRYVRSLTPAPPPILAPAPPSPQLDPGRAFWLRQGRAGIEIAMVEAALLPDPDALLITGQTGREARDAALIARTWVLGAGHLGVSLAGGLHLHIPPGVADVDRDSAGGPLALAVLSLLRGRGLPANVALVGGLGLHGHLLPVGHLPERLAAARGLGFSRLIVAAGHAEELSAIPVALLAGVQVTLAERIDMVLDLLR